MHYFILRMILSESLKLFGIMRYDNSAANEIR